MSRQKLSEELCKKEAEMEASIVDILKNIQDHRDQTQLQKLVKDEEDQSHTLLALKLEEFKNLRKEDILSMFVIVYYHYFLFLIFIGETFFNRCHENAVRTRYYKSESNF